MKDQLKKQLKEALLKAEAKKKLATTASSTTSTSKSTEPAKPAKPALSPSLPKTAKQALISDAASKKEHRGPTAQAFSTGVSKKTAKKQQQPQQSSSLSSLSSLSEMQESMKRKLAGAKFRWINERLYTTHSDVAVELFKKQPELFQIYHEGFSSQVQDWPTNPVDIFIADLRKKPASTVIADMGCGVAQIAQTLHKKMTVHSFDLVAGNSFITACDIAHVPLSEKSCDVVIFCLSLMGTNFTEFLAEAHRILKQGGELKIAEVVSRIPDLNQFKEGIIKMGFRLTHQNTSNKMFVILEFSKSTKKLSESPTDLVLKPCIYKRR
eukprot:jgi/Hompol1/1301/HPOL_004632-RA